MTQKNLHSNPHTAEQLLEIARDLASTLDLEVLLQRIVDAAKKITGAEEASILLYDEGRKSLYFQTVTNAKAEPLLKGLSVPTDSIAGWVALNRQAVIVPDAHQDTRYFVRVEQESNFQTHSIIAVPLLSHEKLIGVLEVLNKHKGTFDEDDLDTLEILAAQASVAIDNARLFRQSDLISELVHELRTPLGSITAITYMLQRPEISEEQRQNLLQTIHQETQRLSELTTSFLDLARLESGRAEFHMAEFDLRKLVDDCLVIVRPKAAEMGIAIIVELPEALILNADKNKIKQVLLNLLSNAIKYNRQGGSILIIGKGDERDVTFAVRDSGQGMDEEALAHLFQKFYRARQASAISGTGLGLSICRRIVESHRGTIRAESFPGQGTTFTVRLPRL